MGAISNSRSKLAPRFKIGSVLRSSRQRITVAAISGVLFAVGIGVAAAGSIHYWPGTVGAGHAWGDNVVHTYYYSSTTTDHTGCTGLSKAGGGVFIPGGGTLQVNGCTNGSGTVGAYGGDGTYWFGAVFNPNVSTTDHFSDSHATY